MVQWLTPGASTTEEREVKVLVAKSCPTLATPWSVARQAPQSVGFSRQEYWSGLPFPSPGDLRDPGIEPRSPVLQEYLHQLSYEGSPKEEERR